MSEQRGQVQEAENLSVCDLSAAQLLDAAEAEQATSWAADVNLLKLAAQWAVMHPEDTYDGYAVHTPALSYDPPLAGPGTPDMAELAINEFAAALHMSRQAARRLIGNAIELQHRLPRTWRLLQSGTMPPWQARRIAEATTHASPELDADAVDWVDRQVAILGGKVGPQVQEGIVQTAILRFGLAEPADGLDPEVGGGVIGDQRRVVLHDQHVGSDGSMCIEAVLDLGDALDLDHAVQQGAQMLKALGSTDSLDARRATALGELARTQTALDLHICTDTATSDDEPTLPAARRLELVVHLSTEALGDGTWALNPVATLEGHGNPVLLVRQIKRWCTQTRTTVRIQPVIDLNVEKSTDVYRPTTLIRRHVELRDVTCVFPWCSQPARTCDLDHTDPWHDPPDDDSVDVGPPQTRTDNLGALCRHHHRLKTHTAWQVSTPAAGTFLWTSPHGRLYARTPHGTTAL